MPTARFLVSVSGPMNIPVFAVGAEKGRAPEKLLDAAPGLSHLLGGNRSRKLLQLFGDKLRLIERRTATPARLAVYSTWIELDGEEATTRFEAVGIPHGVAALSERANKELQALTKAMDADLKAGRFDLSRLSEADRVWRAKEYVERVDSVSKLLDRVLGLAIVAAPYRIQTPEDRATE